MGLPTILQFFARILFFIETVHQPIHNFELPQFKLDHITEEVQAVLLVVYLQGADRLTDFGVVRHGVQVRALVVLQVGRKELGFVGRHQ